MPILMPTHWARDRAVIAVLLLWYSPDTVRTIAG
jgi:hypothetical protein